MWNAVRLRDDYTASDVRFLAMRRKDSAQVRRLLSIAAVYNGMDWGDAARRYGSADIARLGSPVSENDIRAMVTRRKLSGGTRSEAGKQARDTFLGLMKTCRKLGFSF